MHKQAVVYQQQVVEAQKQVAVFQGQAKEAVLEQCALESQ